MGPLGVADGGGIGGLGDDHVRPALGNPGRPKMAVGRGVVVALQKDEPRREGDIYGH